MEWLRLTYTYWLYFQLHLIGKTFVYNTVIAELKARGESVSLHGSSCHPSSHRSHSPLHLPHPDRL